MWDGDDIVVVTHRTLDQLPKDFTRLTLAKGMTETGRIIYKDVEVSSLSFWEDVQDYNQASHSRVQPEFDSVETVFRHWNITKRNYNKWRHVGPIAGSINGIPASEGILWVTDGIMCIIEVVGDRYFEGHIAWFVPKDEDAEIQLDIAMSPKVTEKKPKLKVNLVEYLNL
jgi:hypothetical protein